MVCGLILLPSELFQIVISCKNVNSLMKFKFIHEISVIQETFLVFLACPEGRIKLLRGPDLARGLCIPAIHQPLALQYFRNCLPVPAPGITIPLTFTSSGNALTSTS